ncbi:MAG: NERD domain-containing protein [Lentisphaeria bacterium]|nr:NERD domain-containing protein [Lentisphaeria bacterium]
MEEKSQIPREVSRLGDLLTQNIKTLIPFTRALLYSKDESFSAETADLETLTCLLNFCGCLKDREWIGYEYCKKEKMIKFERLDGFKGEAKVFLSGVFGEYGTVNLIERALQQFAKAKNGFKYKIFHDVKLKKTDSDKPHDIQLDLVVQLPEGFYIFETKTGQVLAVDKWVDRTRLFASEKNRFITCCADTNLNPKIFKPFLLFNLDQLQEQLTDLLQKDYPGS